MVQKKLIALLGHPVAHSKSPLLHNCALKRLELPYSYLAFDIEPNLLSDAVDGLKALGFRGGNVTIPYKVEIIPYLDELTKEAETIGAVNTILWENNRLIGDNTDGKGYLSSLLQDYPKLNIKETTVAIIGAGGAARAIAATLLMEQVKQIFIINRTFSKGVQLSNDLRSLGNIQALDFFQFTLLKKEINLLINTTNVGMYPYTEEMPVDVEVLHKDLIVSDVVYNPKQTLLLRTAEAKGLQIHGGLGMLAYQGALAFKKWTGVEAPIELFFQLLNSEVDEKC